MIKEENHPLIQEIIKEKWLKIWVPKEYNGLGVQFAEGLEILKNIAKRDGSLGWMVTLCAGANYFSRNLTPQTANELFSDTHTCFGGSGMIGGTAEKKDNGYSINGYWKYATGAPYLTHFTINAKITINGVTQYNQDKTEKILSFVIPKNKVTIYPDWQSMGMKSTGTYSFKVEELFIEERYSFIYDMFYTNNELDRIPFRIFADLTLLVNYIGMAENFLLQANKLKPELFEIINQFNIQHYIEKTQVYAHTIENKLIQNKEISRELQQEIHTFGKQFVNTISHHILDIYIQLGIIASQENTVINTIFKDFFTATQHANYRKNSI